MDPVELTAPGLLLRAWRARDARAVLAALREPEVERWNPQGVRDEAGAREWLRRRADPTAVDRLSLAVTDATDGTLLGGASLFQIHDGNASIGYWTAAAARGRGVASRAVTALGGWAFAHLGVHRIELCHAVANPASCRVAARAGYPIEGTMRDSHRYGDGRRHDEHLHARLATDPDPGSG